MGPINAPPMERWSQRLTKSTDSDAETGTDALVQKSDPQRIADADLLDLVPWSSTRFLTIFDRLNRQPDRNTLNEARAARKSLSRFWLTAPVDQLEALYAGPIGQAQRAAINCILPVIPLEAEEEKWKLTLTRRLLDSSEGPMSANILLAVLPYYHCSGIRVTNPLQQVPSWLLIDYANHCDQQLAETLREGPAQDTLLQGTAASPAPTSVPDAATSQSTATPMPLLPNLAPLQGNAAMALIKNNGFHGRINGLIDLYGIDPLDTEIISELAIGRRQVAQVWLDLETKQLEKLYRTPFGRLTEKLILSGFASEPINSQEQNHLLELNNVIREFKHIRSLNALMAALLYYPLKSVNVGRNASSKVPQWLLLELERLRAAD